MTVLTLIILVFAWIFIIRLIYQAIRQSTNNWKYERDARRAKTYRKRALKRPERPLHGQSGTSYHPRK